MPIHRQYDTDFFKYWTRESAYVLGFLYADGNIIRTKRNTHFIAIHTKDKDLLELMRVAIGSDHSISQRSTRSGAVFRLQIGSKVWFEDLCAHGLIPGKAHRMQLPEIPPAMQADFVRGYFDGDGNVWTGFVNRARTRPTVVIQVAFTSASYDFLSNLRSMLHTQGLSGGSLFSSQAKAFSRLQFSNQDALKIYRIMYNTPHKLHLPRKRKVFEEFVRSM